MKTVTGMTETEFYNVFHFLNKRDTSIAYHFSENFTFKDDAENITTEKPPIGLMPEKIHNEKRAIEIMEAITRYQNANLKVPEEWFIELGKKVFGL